MKSPLFIDVLPTSLAFEMHPDRVCIGLYIGERTWDTDLLTWRQYIAGVWVLESELASVFDWKIGGLS